MIMTEIIKFTNIKKAFGTREALKGISFQVNRGDIFGYLGPNGAGKTTSIRILLGLLEADEGQLSILGGERAEAVHRIGFALCPDGLYDEMTAEENLQYYARIYNVQDAGPRVRELLSSAGLSHRAADKVGGFSKGMRQRLLLSRAMIHDPELLVLDEPSSGLDPSAQIEVREQLRDIARKKGKTILLSSHNLAEVQHLCNRIAILDRGKIKLYGELEELRKNIQGPIIEVEIAGDVPQQIQTELKQRFGLLRQKENKFLFSAAEGAAGGGTVNTGGSDVSVIISFLSEKGIKINSAGRKEAGMEELYSSILEEAEGL